MAQISGPPKCPTCGAETKTYSAPGNKLVRACATCGWGQQRLESIRAGVEPSDLSVPEPPPSPQALAIYWVVTAVVAAVPIGLIVAMPGRTLMILIGFALYLGASNAFSPKWDPDNLGLMGLPINNPFSYEDDWNRAMLSLNIMLMPGKFVGRAIVGSVQAARANRGRR